MATRDLINFLKEFRTVRNEWPRKTPNQKYQFIYNIARFSLDLTGLRVLSDLRIVPMTFVSGSVMLSWAVFAIYTIFYFTSDGRFSEGLPCTCLLGIMTSVGIEQNLFLELHHFQFRIFFFSYSPHI